MARLVQLFRQAPQGSTKPWYGRVQVGYQEVNVLLKFARFDSGVTPCLLLNELVAHEVAREVQHATEKFEAAQIFEVSLSPQDLSITNAAGIPVRGAWCIAQTLSQLDPILALGSQSKMGASMATCAFLDFVLLNADRTLDNPNCALHGAKLFLYDFGASLPAPGANARTFDRSFHPPSSVERAQSHAFGSYPTRFDFERNAIFSACQSVALRLERMVERFEGAERDHLRMLLEFLAFAYHNRNKIVESYRRDAFRGGKV